MKRKSFDYNINKTWAQVPDAGFCYTIFICYSETRIMCKSETVYGFDSYEKAKEAVHKKITKLIQNQNKQFERKIK